MCLTWLRLLPVCLYSWRRIWVFVLQNHINRATCFLNILDTLCNFKKKKKRSQNKVRLVSNGKLSAKKATETPKKRRGYDASPSQGYPSIIFNLYIWLKRCTVRTKYLAYDQNTGIPAMVSWFEPRPLDPESKALTIRLTRLPQQLAMWPQAAQAHNARSYYSFKILEWTFSETWPI